MFTRSIAGLTLVFIFALATDLISQGVEGYYRYPALHGQTVYFAAEGDIWKVPLTGGLAQRLTTHPGPESHPEVSPDGQYLAFTARYEGPAEVFVMPVAGGLPRRLTYEPEASVTTTWTPDNRLVYATYHFSTLPDYQLVRVDLESNERSRVPLHQASEGSYADDGTLFFVRPGYHNNVTKRYQGGTARQIWKFGENADEAVKLTTDHPGESHHPMWWNDRVYFITDRDGIMNIWSMDNNGSDLQQHTSHTEFDVRDAGLHEGNLVYHHGADIWHLDLTSGETRKIPITLATDLDQLREKWEDDPKQHITSVNISPDGDKVTITARGRVFVAPAGDGRMVQASRASGVRYRDAVFSADGEDVIVLSDESGEFEFVEIPADGIGEHKALTDNGEILRYQGFPSPNGKWLAFDDLAADMYVMNLETGEQRKISTNQEGIGSIAWAPDSRWVAFQQYAENYFAQIMLYNTETEELLELTTDRANSNSPAWSKDGKFIYFLSDRNFQTLVGSPWGARQPEPYFDRKFKMYHVALQKGNRSPFRPATELDNEKEDGNGNDSDEEADEELVIQIDADGLQTRLEEVPVSPGNYYGLEVSDNTLFWASRGTGIGADTDLHAMSITNDNSEPTPIISNIQGFQLSTNGKKLLVRKNRSIYVVNASASKVNDLSDSEVNLNGWAFPIDVREDWNQIYTDAWRMERDYFYDKNMHGVDWEAMYEKYLPLRDRVTTREELSDVIGRFVGELSALHTSVRGGDVRQGPEDVDIASLGARLFLDPAKGGYRIDHIYKADPDYPHERSPLDDPYLDISEGDVITAIDGDKTIDAPHIGALLRNKAGRQVRLELTPADGGERRDVILMPLSGEYSLRYRDWEYSRRLQVEEASENRIGYVHLRAMGSRDISEWYREFYPVFRKQGLIIDVRHNNGGNIESFILEKLMRRAWMYWSHRSGQPTWNMQYAFRGHIVVLVDEDTASDGEAFAEGFRRLGLGEVIGMRTWGGEIWLSGANRLSDGGIARAPMMGVYGPEGEWLIEGHGVVPDIEVDNLPHETFNGRDRQLETAVDYLLKKIADDPREVPAVPAHPDKSFE